MIRPTISCQLWMGGPKNASNLAFKRAITLSIFKTSWRRLWLSKCLQLTRLSLMYQCKLNLNFWMDLTHCPMKTPQFEAQIYPRKSAVFFAVLGMNWTYQYWLYHKNNFNDFQVFSALLYCFYSPVNLSNYLSLLPFTCDLSLKPLVKLFIRLTFFIQFFHNHVRTPDFSRGSFNMQADLTILRPHVSLRLSNSSVLAGLSW